MRSSKIMSLANVKSRVHYSIMGVETLQNLAGNNIVNYSRLSHHRNGLQIYALNNVQTQIAADYPLQKILHEHKVESLLSREQLCATIKEFISRNWQNSSS